jgi:hypothetical protein
MKNFFIALGLILLNSLTIFSQEEETNEQVIFLGVFNLSSQSTRYSEANGCFDETLPNEPAVWIYNSLFRDCSSPVVDGYFQTGSSTPNPAEWGGVSL